MARVNALDVETGVARMRLSSMPLAPRQSWRA
jgi:hypothetical protein